MNQYLTPSCLSCVIITPILFLVFVVFPSYSGEFYTYTDESGNTIISDYPPPEKLQKSLKSRKYSKDNTLEDLHAWEREKLERERLEELEAARKEAQEAARLKVQLEEQRKAREAAAVYSRINAAGQKAEDAENAAYKAIRKIKDMEDEERMRRGIRPHPP